MVEEQVFRQELHVSSGMASRLVDPVTSQVIVSNQETMREKWHMFVDAVTSGRRCAALFSLVVRREDRSFVCLTLHRPLL